MVTGDVINTLYYQQSSLLYGTRTGFICLWTGPICRLI